MKISIEHYVGQPEEQKATLEISDESDVFELVDAFFRLGIAIGYHPESMLDGFNSLLENNEYFLTDKDEGIGEDTKQE
jgi:hypothetical protein